MTQFSYGLKLINFKILNLRFKHFSIDFNVKLYVLLVCVEKDDEKERENYMHSVYRLRKRTTTKIKRLTIVVGCIYSLYLVPCISNFLYKNIVFDKFLILII